MAASREQHTATLLATGKVLITGGVQDSVLASAELYDPSSGTFSPTGSMTTLRCSHTAIYARHLGDVASEHREVTEREPEQAASEQEAQPLVEVANDADADGHEDGALESETSPMIEDSVVAEPLNRGLQ